MYKIPETSINQKVGDELVILNLESGHYFGLDEVGARMVELIGEHGEVDKVVACMVEEYDASQSQIKADLEDLLKELTKNNLIVEIP